MGGRRAWGREGMFIDPGLCKKMRIFLLCRDSPFHLGFLSKVFELLHIFTIAVY